MSNLLFGLRDTERTVASFLPPADCRSLACASRGNKALVNRMWVGYFFPHLQEMERTTWIGRMVSLHPVASDAEKIALVRRVHRVTARCLANQDYENTSQLSFAELNKWATKESDQALVERLSDILQDTDLILPRGASIAEKATQVRQWIADYIQVIPLSMVYKVAAAGNHEIMETLLSDRERPFTSDALVRCIWFAAHAPPFCYSPGMVQLILSSRHPISADKLTELCDRLKDADSLGPHRREGVLRLIRESGRPLLTPLEFA